MTTLTDRQKAVLDVIQKAIEQRGYPPSLREIGAALRITGTRAVEKHVQALEKKGYLRKGRGARAIDLVHRALGREVPVLGTVTAGKPILAEENRLGTLTLDPAVARWEDCFLLKVRGESMRDAGILDGDFVLVKPQSSADPGEIVLALLGDEATVKRWGRKGSSHCLLPENPAFEPIRIDEHVDFKILGKVVGVFRFYSEDRFGSAGVLG